MNDALKIAIEEFKNFHIDKDIEIKYLATPYLVKKNGDCHYLRSFARRIGAVPNFSNVAYVESGTREKIIILHYLIHDKGFPLTGKRINPEGVRLSSAEVPAEWVDFRDVPSGSMYNSVFEARVYQPFLDRFGKNPSLFIKSSEALEGEKVDIGDIAFRFMALPKIPIIFILHTGDEEFPPACKVLFDSSVAKYLPTEDIAILCEDLVTRLSLQCVQNS